MILATREHLTSAFQTKHNKAKSMGLQVAYHLLKIRGILTLSNTCTVALPDLYFHWPR